MRRLVVVPLRGDLLPAAPEASCQAPREVGALDEGRDRGPERRLEVDAFLVCVAVFCVGAADAAAKLDKPPFLDLPERAAALGAREGGQPADFPVRFGD